MEQVTGIRARHASAALALARRPRRAVTCQARRRLAWVAGWPKQVVEDEKSLAERTVDRVN